MAGKVYNKKSTAKEIADDFSEVLKQKTVVVTGGNIGIGLETVKALASVGCRVLLLSRSLDNATKAIEMEIKKSGTGNYTVTNGDIKVVLCDLNDLDSIKNCANEILKEERIDFLINNAGIMAPPKKLTTKYGWEMQLATNHYGHFYLTSLLMPKMKAQNFESRIINISSLLHEKCAFDIEDLHYEKRPYDAW